MKKTILTVLTLALSMVACAEDGDPGVPGAAEERIDLPPIAEYEQQRQPTRVTIDATEGRRGESHPWTMPAVADPAPPMTPGLDYAPQHGADTGGIRLPKPSEPRLGENAAPDPQDQLYRRGELCTYDAAAWAGDCEGGCLLDAHFEAVFPDGIELGRGDKRFALTNADAIRKALPGMGAATALVTDQVNPPAQAANRLAAELAVLHLNIAYSRAGHVGTEPFDDAMLLVGPLRGWSVVHVAELAERALDGDDYLGLVPVSREVLADELASLNRAAPACRPDDFISRVAR